MENSFVVMCMMLVAPVFAAEQPGFIESILLSIHHRPWLIGLYVFVVGLPIILFISFMWPDKRFGPPNQPYYYKKLDDIQPDDPETSPLRESADSKGSRSSKETLAGKTTSTHKRNLSKHF
ncbi:calnexin [Kryptolebias marmoratus]|uniref:calnexin n=1 Tax=Kryptolebias marmoratus TaxID=37003 RepID=UPI0007F8ACF0|nr:calnexin [Kryptolebias marmoratus]